MRVLSYHCYAPTKSQIALGSNGWHCSCLNVSFQTHKDKEGSPIWLDLRNFNRLWWVILEHTVMGSWMYDTMGGLTYHCHAPIKSPTSFGGNWWCRSHLSNITFQACKRGSILMAWSAKLQQIAGCFKSIMIWDDEAGSYGSVGIVSLPYSYQISNTCW